LPHILFKLSSWVPRNKISRSQGNICYSSSIPCHPCHYQLVGLCIKDRNIPPDWRHAVLPYKCSSLS